MSSDAFYNRMAAVARRLLAKYGTEFTFLDGGMSEDPLTGEMRTSCPLPPVASAVSFTGELKEDKTLTGVYTYTDPQDYAEGNSLYEWIVADDAAGLNAAAISGATAQTYELTIDEVSKYVAFRVTPVNDADIDGTTVTSPYSGPIATSDILMPDGLFGLFYADQYDAAAHAIPNEVLGNPLSMNLIRGGRRLFANGEVWGIAGVVSVTDDSAPDPYGNNEASTIEVNGNWYISKVGVSVAMPAGTYTIAISAKRNAATDQFFCFTSTNTAILSPVMTATAVWQDFAWTFTKDSSWNLGTAFPCSIDASTGAKLHIIDYRIYAGNADLLDSGADGNLYLGASAPLASPSFADDVVDMSAGGYGFIQLPETITVTGATAIAVISKVALSNGYHSFLSKIQSYLQFTAMTDINKVPYAGIGSWSQLDNKPGMWNLLNLGFCAISQRSTGTQQSLWFNDIKIFENDTATSSISLRDFFVGLVNGPALPSGLKFNSIAAFDRALDDSELCDAVSLLIERAEENGLTIANPRIIIADGDSLTENGYPFDYGATASPTFIGGSPAASGYGLSEIELGAGRVKSIIPPEPGSREFIYTLLIGTNDLANYVGGAAQYAIDLGAHMLDVQGAGFRTGLCTILPTTNSSFNTARNALNGIVTAGGWAAANGVDDIIPFGSSSPMGPDSAASDGSLYSDGQHPTALGHQHLATVYASIYND